MQISFNALKLLLLMQMHMGKSSLDNRLNTWLLSASTTGSAIGIEPESDIIITLETPKVSLLNILLC
jgi:hypothetical protein